MRNQKAVSWFFGGLMIFLAAVFIVLSFRVDWSAPEANNVILFGIITLSVYLAAAVALGWDSWWETHDPAVIESIEIYNARWGTTGQSGPLKTRDWDKWIESVDTGKNESRYRWKPGWNLDRIEREVLSNETLWDNFERDRANSRW
jgi:hypothetical protein